MERTFAEYILSEEDWIGKLETMFYLKGKAPIFFDKTVIFKTEIAKLFIENAGINVDKNLVLTASLLCGCKKTNDFSDLAKIKAYAKDGADYLSSLGFSDDFCKICEQVNRYSQSTPRTKEGDILELADQFGGMLLDRPERIGFKPDEALTLLEYRNLKDKDNIYLEKFKDFVNALQEMQIALEPALQKYAKMINMAENTKQAIVRTAEFDEKFIQVKEEHENLEPEIEEEKNFEFNPTEIEAIVYRNSGRENFVAGLRKVKEVKEKSEKLVQFNTESKEEYEK